MLNDILHSLGLADDEVKLYVALLENGSLTAGALAKKVGVPRTTLYTQLQKLADKGVVLRSLKKGVRSFAAEDPEKLDQLFAKQIELIQSKRQAYQDMMPLLKQQYGSAAMNPRYQFFEGKEGVQHVLSDMLMYYDCETLAFWPIKQMIDILSEDFFRYHNKQRIQNNLYTRAIWPESEAVDIKNNPFLGIGEAFRREIRIAPTGVHCTMGYWMYQNKVAFLSSRAESFGFIIESQELVTMLKTQFEMIWPASTPVTVDPKHTQGFIDGLND